MSADLNRAAPTLIDCFQRSVSRTPYARALELRDEAYSYRQLDQYSRVLAERMLIACGSRPERVGLLASRSLLSFVGYLAALRLGASLSAFAPWLVIPVARRVLRRMVGHLLIDATDSRLGAQIERIKKRGVKLNIKGLRHYTASQLLAARFDLRNTAARLGHGSGGATTLRHYADPVSEVDRRTAAYLAQLTAGSVQQGG